MAAMNKDFSGRLQGLMEEKGFSQRFLAQNTGITEASAHKYCKKGGVPEWDILLRIAKLFEVSVDYLLTGQSSPTHDERDAEGVLQLRRKDDPQSAETKELLDLARKVLKSDDDLSKKALTESIRALSRPVKDDNPIKKRARRRSA